MVDQRIDRQFRFSPLKPENPEQYVGINVGILSYMHDSDGFSVSSLNLSDEHKAARARATEALAEGTHSPVNYRKQQRIVAQRHADLKRKLHDFLHRLSVYQARETTL